MSKPNKSLARVWLGDQHQLVTDDRLRWWPSLIPLNPLTNEILRYLDVPHVPQQMQAATYSTFQFNSSNQQLQPLILPNSWVGTVCQRDWEAAVSSELKRSRLHPMVS